MDDDAALYLNVLRRSVEHLFKTLEGLDTEGLNWRPPVKGANSLYVLTAHVLANIERNVLHHFGGRAYDWWREEEFAAAGESADELREQWARLVTELVAVLEGATPEDLDALREHPNMGQVQGRAVLMRAVTHAREHLGQAQLTRDWWERREDRRVPETYEPW
jgi:hypothetical protein